MKAIDPLGGETVTEYDPLGRVVKTTDAKGNSATRTYDAIGNILTVTDALNHGETYVCDDMNNVIKQARQGDGSSVLQILRQKNRPSVFWLNTKKS